MVGIIDYGVGNLFSLTASLHKLGVETRMIREGLELKTVDRIILPGVGAFGDAKAKLDQSGLVDPLLEACQGGKPLLGICLGMQLLFEASEEYGITPGLGLIPGKVVPLKTDLKVPHIGWNALEIKEDPLFRYIKNGDYVYYVHSFGGICEESYIIGSSQYHMRIVGAVKSDRVYGTQFHPEKSGPVGLNILRGFVEL